MVRNFLTLLAGSLLVVACADKDGDGTPTNDDADDGADTSGNSSFDPSATSTSGNGESDESTSSDEPETSGASVSFIETQDGGTATVECDVWSQDCPDGEKCMPWSNDGTSAWNATKCTPVEANPGQVGDDCTVEGSGTSGIDTCDVASMCYYVDPETNQGICVGFCMGTQAAPVCNPGFICSIVNSGVLILCRPDCDPLAQDCDFGASCLQATGSDGFTCIIDASGDGGAAGDPCEYINACNAGLFCASAAVVPNCQAASGCCTEFCDLDDPDPASYCSASGQGAECIPWFDEGTSPPDYTHVGACVLP
jgi:hypothetical protein